jgi:uncharacterized coiled-coil protein SlyX
MTIGECADVALAGYYDPAYPDPDEEPRTPAVPSGALTYRIDVPTLTLYPTKPEGITSDADERYKALEQRVEALETTLADGLTAAYLLGCAETRELIGPLAQRLDSLIEQVLALQAHVQRRDANE